MLPGTRLRLKNQLEVEYLTKLKDWVGEERTHYLVSTYRSLATLLPRLDPSITDKEARKKARDEKNSLILEMRNQLDKAFSEIYLKKYGTKPTKKNGQFIPLYFPFALSPEKDTDQQIGFYFHHVIKTPSFAADLPEIYAYIQEIQPHANPVYFWLWELRELANTQKHGDTLPAEPEVNNQVVDMREFLPQALKGITEILLKFFCPQATPEEIDSMSLDQYITIYPPPSLVLESSSPLLQRASSSNDNLQQDKGPRFTLSGYP